MLILIMLNVDTDIACLIDKNDIDWLIDKTAIDSEAKQHHLLNSNASAAILFKDSKGRFHLLIIFVGFHVCFVWMIQ